VGINTIHRVPDLISTLISVERDSRSRFAIRLAVSNYDFLMIDSVRRFRVLRFAAELGDCGEGPYIQRRPPDPESLMLNIFERLRCPFAMALR
jgi:hypothetical protein